MMAESRRYAANQQLDLQQIQDDAKQRWLRPVEICEILQNYQKLNIAEAPPNQPRGCNWFPFQVSFLHLLSLFLMVILVSYEENISDVEDSRLQ
ncbi:hypothetical protein SLEP1_g18677 [Rubroshorea leprosula]|uniref:CG-1 domain-containing protein n=1 Tax=Rubroshorea leprosula TaxID=152421 RepID=A0AAV5J4A8_9ROSI|nr:hypothetical protein SLEP1_g18677 [Rubroshorea leprosula]